MIRKIFPQCHVDFQTVLDFQFFDVTLQTFLSPFRRREKACHLSRKATLSNDIHFEPHDMLISQSGARGYFRDLVALSPSPLFTDSCSRTTCRSNCPASNDSFAFGTLNPVPTRSLRPVKDGRFAVASQLRSRSRCVDHESTKEWKKERETGLSFAWEGVRKLEEFGTRTRNEKRVNESSNETRPCLWIVFHLRKSRNWLLSKKAFASVR